MVEGSGDTSAKSGFESTATILEEFFALEYRFCFGDLTTDQTDRRFALFQILQRNLSKKSFFLTGNKRTSIRIPFQRNIVFHCNGIRERAFSTNISMSGIALRFHREIPGTDEIEIDLTASLLFPDQKKKTDIAIKALKCWQVSLKNIAGYSFQRLTANDKEMIFETIRFLVCENLDHRTLLEISKELKFTPSSVTQ